MVSKTIQKGIIVKVLSGLYTVETDTEILECKARGIFRKREISPMCGDKVTVENENGSNVISEIDERKNFLIRPPLANVDMLVFVISTCEPSPNFVILDKFIAISEYKGIKPLIVVTKIDLEGIDKITQIYNKVGIDVFSVDNTTGKGVEDIISYLDGKFSAFTGNTGVGKSSLLNKIFPGALLKTNEISKKLGRGKHTTTHVEMYKLGNSGYIADTPGFSTFETNKYDIILKNNLAYCFTEFEPFMNKCKYMDCSHTKEDGCCVIKAVNDGIISKSRHRSYVEMYEQARQIKEWEFKK